MLNYFWLLSPTLDTIPGSGSLWYKGYKPVKGLVDAVIADILLDEVLLRKASAQPHKFAAWWHRQDPSIYDVCNYLPAGWSITVLERAHEASARMKQATATR